MRRAEGTYREFPVYDVCEDRDGAMWFGLQNGEVVRYQPGAGAWRLYTNRDGMETGWGPHIAQTRDGVVWVVSDDGRRGVNRFDGQAWTHFSLGDQKGSNINTSILETQDGTLWVGGFALHFLQDGRWRVSYPPGTGFPWHRTRLLEASDGALWVAGLGQTAARLAYRTSRWTTCEGLWFQCDTPHGAQWFLSRDSSVVRYDGRAWTRYGVEDGLIEAPVALLATGGGCVGRRDSQRRSGHGATQRGQMVSADAPSGQGGRAYRQHP